MTTMRTVDNDDVYCDECLTHLDLGSTYYTDVYYAEYNAVFVNCQDCYNLWLADKNYPN